MEYWYIRKTRYTISCEHQAPRISIVTFTLDALIREHRVLPLMRIIIGTYLGNYSPIKVVKVNNSLGTVAALCLTSYSKVGNSKLPLSTPGNIRPYLLFGKTPGKPSRKKVLIFFTAIGYAPHIRKWVPISSENSKSHFFPDSTHLPQPAPAPPSIHFSPNSPPTLLSPFIQKMNILFEVVVVSLYFSYETKMQSAGGERGGL